MKDYYEILGVDRDSDLSDIKKAYKKMAMQYHPDKNPGDPVSEEKFKEISEAYAVIGDKEKRARYDMGDQRNPNMPGAAWEQGFPFDPQDLFGFFGGQRPGATSTRLDINGHVAINLEQAFSGIKLPLSFERDGQCSACDGTGEKNKQANLCVHCGGTGKITKSHGFFTMSSTCSACGGHGRKSVDACTKCHGKGTEKENVEINVDVPPGIVSGTVLRIAGKGNVTVGRIGDFYLTVSVQQHHTVLRNNQDLHCNLKIPVISAILGGETEVSGFFGDAKVYVHPGAQPGEEIRVKGYGMPDGVGNRGDLFVHLEVEVPKNLSNSERELYERIRDSEKSRGKGI